MSLSTDYNHSASLPLDLYTTDICSDCKAYSWTDLFFYCSTLSQALSCSYRKSHGQTDCEADSFSHEKALSATVSRSHYQADCQAVAFSYHENALCATVVRSHDKSHGQADAFSDTETIFPANNPGTKHLYGCGHHPHAHPQDE